MCHKPCVSAGSRLPQYPQPAGASTCTRQIHPNAYAGRSIDHTAASSVPILCLDWPTLDAQAPKLRTACQIRAREGEAHTRGSGSASPYFVIVVAGAVLWCCIPTQAHLRSIWHRWRRLCDPFCAQCSRCGSNRAYPPGPNFHSIHSRLVPPHAHAKPTQTRTKHVHASSTRPPVQPKPMELPWDPHGGITEPGNA